MAKKITKVISRRKKFIEIDLPIINSKVELIGNSLQDLENKTIKLDLTRNLRGKAIEALLKIEIKQGKPIVRIKKLTLMSYFIRRMIRKRISYIEDSFDAQTKESIWRIKPFLITRKKISRAVKKTLRNKAKNWIEDSMIKKTNEEFLKEILTNKFQRTLSLVLKKTYPLSLCEIRILELKKDLEIKEKELKIDKKEVKEGEADKKDIKEGEADKKDIRKKEVKEGEADKKEVKEGEIDKKEVKEGEADKKDIRKKEVKKPEETSKKILIKKEGAQSKKTGGIEKIKKSRKKPEKSKLKLKPKIAKKQIKKRLKKEKS